MIGSQKCVVGKLNEELGNTIYDFQWMIHQEAFWDKILHQIHISKWTVSITNFIHARGLHYKTALFSQWYVKRAWRLDILHRCLLFVLTQCAVMISEEPRSDWDWILNGFKTWPFQLISHETYRSWTYILRENQNNACVWQHNNL
jgi:hypothetical protein